MVTASGEGTPNEFSGRLAQGKDWREIVAWVGDLPPMPHVAARAISMVENPATTAPELSELLSSDTALAARVLKIANSAMFSRQREITTLNQAIMIIGFKALKGIVVAATLRQINKRFGALERLIWENSMCSAVAATKISKQLKKRYVEEIFLLSLLHSLGQVVFLAQNDTANDYKLVLELVKKQGFDFAQGEQQIFGFSHPLIGALVAKKWNFSAETCQVILHYKDAFDGAPDDELEEKTLLVQLSDLVAHAAGFGNAEGYPDTRPQIAVLAKHLGLPDDEKSIETLISEIQQQFQAERGIYD